MNGPERSRDDNVHRLKDRGQVEDEAAAWVWRLDDEAAGAEVRAEFEAWLAADPRHRAAYRELAGVWSGLDALAALKQDHRIQTVRHGVREEELQRRLPVPLGWARAAAVAASLLVAVAVGWFGLAQVFSPVEPAARQWAYATAVGQQRTVDLPDGSSVELNTNTILKVDFSGQQRLLSLDKGEAHFDVARDENRPFIVRAGDTEVRALGTAFNVHRRLQAPVEVIVTEGVVEVVRSAEPLSEPPRRADPYPDVPVRLRLEAGQSVGVAPSVPVQAAQAANAVEPVDAARELAWREGMLVFEGEPLESVVEELSRYTEARFVILDDSIRTRRVGGYFRTDDVEALLDVLEQGLSVDVRRQGESLILLADKAEPSAG